MSLWCGEEYDVLENPAPFPIDFNFLTILDGYDCSEELTSEVAHKQDSPPHIAMNDDSCKANIIQDGYDCSEELTSEVAHKQDSPPHIAMNDDSCKANIIQDGDDYSKEITSDNFSEVAHKQDSPPHIARNDDYCGANIIQDGGAVLTLVSDTDSHRQKEKECTTENQASANLGLLRKDGMIRQGVREKRSSHVREEKLMWRWLSNKERVRFGDIQRNDYECMTREIFHIDILNIMYYHRADIYREGEYYCCRGILKKQKAPAENVAIAMFKFLKKEPTLFELKFQLYSQGYRQYTPDTLGHIEMALVVAGVHPLKRKLNSVSLDFCKEASKTWGEVQNFSQDQLYEYLHKPYKPSIHRCTFFHHKRLKRTLLILWLLKNEGHLNDLQRMRAEIKDTSPCCMPSVGFSTSKGERQNQIATILKKHVNQELPLESLRQMVLSAKGYTTYTKPYDFLKTVLMLAIGEWPIVYNKTAQTVMLLENAIPEVPPKKNTNLLVAVHELYTQYDKQWTKEEVMYYAYRGGECSQALEKINNKKLVFDHIEQYRDMLVMQGYIDALCCATKKVFDIERQKNIYALVAEEDVVRELCYYQGFCGKGITQFDIDAVTAVKNFERNPTFLVFLDYIKERRKMVTSVATVEELVIAKLRKGPVLLSSFVRLCPGFGIQTSREMWGVIGDLSRRQGGRLLYNHKTTMLRWKENGCAPKPEKDALVSEVFSLKSDNPYMQNQILLHVIKQEGFQDVTLHDVHQILQGLSLLGLYSTYENDCVRERGLVRLILSQTQCGGYTGWQWNIAQKVVDWLRDGSIRKLWKVYIDMRDGPPLVKRQKIQNPIQSPVDIMRRELPMYYEILLQKIQK